MIKLLYHVVKINNTGVTGQSLPPKNDFEHARGLRNSAYAVNLPYETYRHTYIHIVYIYISREISIEHPSVGLASLAQLVTLNSLLLKHFQNVITLQNPPTRHQTILWYLYNTIPLLRNTLNRSNATLFTSESTTRS